MKKSMQTGNFVPKFFLGIVSIIAMSIFAAPAAMGHEQRPAIVTAEFSEEAVSVTIDLNLEAYLAGIEPDHSDTGQSPQSGAYNALRLASPERLRQEVLSRDTFAQDLSLTINDKDLPLTLSGISTPPVGDPAMARTSSVTFQAALPEPVRTVAWASAPGIGDFVFRVTSDRSSDPVFAEVFAAGIPTGEIELDATGSVPLITVADYVQIGFAHILPKGLDHILFIVGLFLLSARLGPLLWQVTGFTLAHSVTLAMGVIGWVSIPAEIVEPLIAASIIFIAVENLFTDRLKRWRPVVVFGFGLLHGLGFAGVLSEIGLPQGDYFWALVGFNIGVEVGQLAVLALCFLMVGVWFRERDWYRSAITMPASAMVAMVGAFWFVERIA